MYWNCWNVDNYHFHFLTKNPNTVYTNYSLENPTLKGLYEPPGLVQADKEYASHFMQLSGSKDKQKQRLFFMKKMTFFHVISLKPRKSFT